MKYGIKNIALTDIRSAETKYSVVELQDGSYRYGCIDNGIVHILNTPQPSIQPWKEVLAGYKPLNSNPVHANLRLVQWRENMNSTGYFPKDIVNVEDISILNKDTMVVLLVDGTKWKICESGEHIFLVEHMVKYIRWNMPMFPHQISRKEAISDKLYLRGVREAIVFDNNFSSFYVYYDAHNKIYWRAMAYCL